MWKINEGLWFISVGQPGAQRESLETVLHVTKELDGVSLTLQLRGALRMCLPVVAVTARPDVASC